jgi:hypothetical protein
MTTHATFHQWCSAMEHLHTMPVWSSTYARALSGVCEVSKRLHSADRTRVERVRSSLRNGSLTDGCFVVYAGEPRRVAGVTQGVAHLDDGTPLFAGDRQMWHSTGLHLRGFDILEEFPFLKWKPSEGDVVVIGPPRDAEHARRVSRWYGHPGVVSARYDADRGIPEMFTVEVRNPVKDERLQLEYLFDATCLFAVGREADQRLCRALGLPEQRASSPTS